MEENDDLKECIYCAELIKKKARLCRFCNREQTSDTQSQVTKIDSTAQSRAAAEDLFAQDKSETKQRQLDQAIAAGNFPIAVSLLPPERAIAYQAESSRISKGLGAAYLLLILTWFVGGHKFYIREPLWGLAYLGGGLGSWLLVLTVVGIPVAIGLGVILFVGCAFDLFLLPSQVSRSNDLARLDLLRVLADGAYTQSGSAPVNTTALRKTSFDYTWIAILPALVAFGCLAASALLSVLPKQEVTSSTATATKPEVLKAKEQIDSGSRSGTNRNSEDSMDSVNSVPDESNSMGSSSTSNSGNQDPQNDESSDTNEIIDSILLSERDGDTEGVQAGLEKLQRIKPALDNSTPDAISANDRGLAELRSGNNEEAIRLLQEATTSNPTSSKYFNNLGLAELNAERFQAAQSRFQKSISLEPTKTIAWGNLAVALAKQGNRDLAVSSMLVGVHTSKEKALKFMNDFDKEDAVVQAVISETLNKISR